MRYIPHTDADREEMLKVIGVSTIEHLFADIPSELRLKRRLDIPQSLDEYALFRELGIIGERNRSLDKVISFLGAGVYEHYIPSTVLELISRGEFLSAYTPYQPEVSQGFLQTVYEFQSMMCEITGMEVCNASLYDGATSLAEAAIMCACITGRKKILIADSIHPHYKDAVQTLTAPLGCEVNESPLEEIEDGIDASAACVLFQYPDFFGRIHNPARLINAARDKGVMTVAACEPIALGVLEPPSSKGVDVMVGEAQPLGVPMGFGGPHLGTFCVNRKHIRSIPGRIVGRTFDGENRRGFVMTLRAREQDIRREKATSNICTNQALMALAATVWMAALGKNGFRQVAETCVQKAHYAANELIKIPGVSLKWPDARFAFEFTLNLGQDASVVRDRLLQNGLLAGLPLGGYFPEHNECLLVAVTEVRTKKEIDDFVAAAAKVMSECLTTR